MRKPNRSDTNRVVQAQKTTRDWNLRLKEEELYYSSREAKIKMLINFAVTVKLICALCWFSHDTAHIDRSQKQTENFARNEYMDICKCLMSVRKYNDLS